MDEKRKMPKWAKNFLIFGGILILLFILLSYFFDPRTGLCGGIRQADSYSEVTCFDKQYLNEFKENPSVFLLNRDSYALSMYKVEIKDDKHMCTKNREPTFNTYFAIRNDGELKEVSREDIDTFLDSYCEDCLMCYYDTYFIGNKDNRKFNHSSLKDYRTYERFCEREGNNDWVCYDEPQLPMF